MLRVKHYRLLKLGVMLVLVGFVLGFFQLRQAAQLADGSLRDTLTQTFNPDYVRHISDLRLFGTLLLGAGVLGAILSALSLTTNPIEGRSLSDAMIGGPGHGSTIGEFMRCPECAEVIRSEATKCRYCGSDVMPAKQGTDCTSQESEVERELLSQIANAKAVLKAQDTYAAADLFELGRAYALLYDVTGSDVHRTAAFKYAAKAHEIDASAVRERVEGAAFLTGDVFGSLESDPQFEALGA